MAGRYHRKNERGKKGLIPHKAAVLGLIEELLLRNDLSNSSPACLKASKSLRKGAVIKAAPFFILKF